MDDDLKEDAHHGVHGRLGITRQVYRVPHPLQPRIFFKISTIQIYFNKVS